MKHRRKTKVPALLALVLVAVLFMTMGAAAFAAAEETVSYVDAQGKTQSTQATPLTGEMTAWESGWYVARDSVSIEQRITVTGTVHLILADGAALDAKQGITTTGAALTIYGQSAGTGTLTASGAQNAAGIGGVLGKAGGTVTVNGGAVTATGGNGGAGIGGGYRGRGGTVTVNGGTVTATGNNGGMGIGSGSYAGRRNGALTLGAGLYLYGGESEATAAYAHKADGDYMRSPYMQVNRDIPTALTVTYDLNRGKGEVPADPERYTLHDTFTVLPNTGERKGYIFAEWNTKPDGSGRAYAPGETDVISGNITLYAQWVLPYIDRVGSTMIEVLCDDYIVVTGRTTSFEDGKWYAAEGDVTVNSRITVNGTAHLILVDGANLDANQGITTTGAVLNIYGQSAGTGTLTAAGSGNAAGIGGGWRGADGGTITINGGTVFSGGGDSAAAIGGSWQGAGGMITINGGTIRARGAYTASAIGGGDEGAGGTVTINGGRVTAIGGDWAAGIGGGGDADGGTVTINGGTVDANGYYGGAGIGGGNKGAGGTVTINGGSVKATGKNGGMGIGAGNNAGGRNGTLTLGEGLYLYGGGSAAEAVYVPEADGDYRRSSYMEVNDTVRSYKVGYELNGGTGTTPTDEKIYLAGDEVTVLPNAAEYAGFAFGGWNTKADGRGTTYMPGETFRITGNTTLYARWVIPYMDWNGSTLVETDINTRMFDPVTDSTIALSDGKWYVVTENVTIKDRISVNGTVRLILCDGVKLEAQKGISLAEGKHLIIYGQSGGTGALEATAIDLENCAAIGGDAKTTGGQLTVNGGSITANGGSNSAGIGGGNEGAGGTITVNGGSVTADGSFAGAGIGGGRKGAGGMVTVNGGSITATGGSNSAGIGGGDEGAGGTVTINGGSVMAYGGYVGAGIGGNEGAGGTVTINGGTIEATGGRRSAGISGTVTINGGDVTASGGKDGAGISGAVTLGTDMIVWAGDKENPRDTGRNVTGTFAADHRQKYVYAYRGLPLSTITGADLVLDGTLKLRFHVSLPEGFSDNSAVMDLTVHGRTLTQKLSDAEKIDGKYAFICPVYAIEMAEPVTAVFHSSDGIAEKTVSVREYLDGLEAKKDQLGLSASDTAKLTNMITAVRNYGHYMQPYLAGAHAFTVGEGKDYRAMPAGSDINPLTALPAYKRVWGENRYDPGVVSSIHYYDSFGESTTLNIDLQFKGRVRSLSVTVDGEDWDLMGAGVNTWRISIPDIAANNLGKAFHVVATANGSVVYDAYLSALSYVSAVLDTQRDNPDEAKALTAFYQYYEAARAFE